MEHTMQEKPILLVFVKDMIFRSRITAVAAETGVVTRAVRTVADLQKELGGGNICGLIVDLNSTGAEIAEIASAALPTLDPNLITTYFSHVDVELAEEAKRLGFSRIMPRSRFVNELPEMISIYSHK
jgi:hypothetical protein